MKKNFFFFLAVFPLLIYAQQCTILDAGDDVLVTPSQNCTTLSGSFSGDGIGASSQTYRIENLTTCEVPLPSGTVNILPVFDDMWSDLIQLPFDFEFFGQTYNTLIIGGNGVVSFDTNRTSPQEQQPGATCAWQLNDALPNSMMFRNTIYGAYHDLDLTRGGNVKYYISGTAPFRKFVIAYGNVPHFACNDLYTTQYIILHETANIVDVYIEHKDLCATWNNGNAVVGIQNETGDTAYVPAGRNTGPWEVLTPELWRFIPNTNPQTIQPNFIWYEDITNAQVGTGLQADVCVTQNTTYRLEAVFTHPTTGQTMTISDTVMVYYNNTNALTTKERTEFQIVPNPAADQCVIYLPEASGEFKIKLIDISGKIISTNSTRDKQITMDLTKPAKGIYWIQILFPDQKVITRKLIKQ